MIQIMTTWVIALSSRQGFVKIQGDTSVLFLDLPSFLWLWRAAAWAMGFTIAAYFLLALSGLWLGWRERIASPSTDRADRDVTRDDAARGMRVLHLGLGAAIVFLVLFLLAIGIVGTLGHFGELGQSAHLPVGLSVVGLTIAAAVAGLRIRPDRRYARAIHRTIVLSLSIALGIVSYTGWEVVQKYLPPA